VSYGVGTSCLLGQCVDGFLHGRVVIPRFLVVPKEGTYIDYVFDLLCVCTHVGRRLFGPTLDRVN